MNRIRELRKERKITMKELGKAVGVSESTISLYENGKHEPDLLTLGRIADYFGVTVDDLMGRTADDTAEWPWFDESDETFRLFARGMAKMSHENRQKLLDVARVMFKEDFDEEGNKRVP